MLLKGDDNIQKVLLTNGNIFKRTDDRWGATVRYRNEEGKIKRKSFSGTSKRAVKKKVADYVSQFNDDVIYSNDGNRRLDDSMREYLRVFKFPSVERVTYDRDEQVMNNQIIPYIGNLVVSNITAAQIKELLNTLTDKGYSFSTVKQTYNLLGEYFEYLLREEYITRNPMLSVDTLRKANFYSKQGKEIKSPSESITVFTPEEIELLKKECFRTWDTGKPIYQQSASYIFMLNTGLRTAEALGLLNKDIDLEKKIINVHQGVKEVQNREGFERRSGRSIEIGKLKTASSRRIVPLNAVAIDMIKRLREEFYFGEDTPLICNSNGDYTRPSNFRKRFYRILNGAGIETKGLHALRHTFATNLVNGVRQADGTIKALSPKQVADLLGHSTSEITELYYVKRNDDMLHGITEGFEL